jgi:hypothetical protein
MQPEAAGAHAESRKPQGLVGFGDRDAEEAVVCPVIPPPSSVNRGPHFVGRAGASQHPPILVYERDAAPCMRHRDCVEQVFDGFVSVGASLGSEVDHGAIVARLAGGGPLLWTRSPSTRTPRRFFGSKPKVVDEL